MQLAFPAVQHAGEKRRLIVLVALPCYPELHVIHSHIYSSPLVLYFEKWSYSIFFFLHFCLAVNRHHMQEIYNSLCIEMRMYVTTS